MTGFKEDRDVVGVEEEKDDLQQYYRQSEEALRCSEARQKLRKLSEPNSPVTPVSYGAIPLNYSSFTLL
ncbi:unnamed protein product [Caretta caretta]